MIRNKELKTVLCAIVLFSIIGGIFAYITLLAHFDGDVATFCTINETFDCDVVNQSSYSEFLGIPVAAMGLLAYVFFGVAAIALMLLRRRSISNDPKQKEAQEKLVKSVIDVTTFFVVIGLAFSLYLTSIEAFVLKTWCILCIGSQITILIITGLVFRLRRLMAK